jgi:hypothetical protein
MAAVGHAQQAPAAPTSQEPAKQGRAATRGLGRPRGLAEAVAGEAFLVALILRPRDVRLVMVEYERGPGGDRLRPAVELAHDAVNNLGLHVGLAVGVGSGVERVLQDRNHILIDGWLPAERMAPPAVRRAREQEPLAVHVEEDLARGAQPIEEPKHGANRLLYATVGIQHQAEIARPDIADRHEQTQLTATGLRHGGVEHAPAQQRQLEFAHRTL